MSDEYDDSDDRDDSGALDRFFKRQDRMNKLLDSPVTRALRSLTEHHRKVMRPFSPLLEQQERIARLFDSPTARAMRSMTDRSQNLLKALNPAMEEQKRLRDLFDPPATRDAAARILTQIAVQKLTHPAV